MKKFEVNENVINAIVNYVRQNEAVQVLAALQTIKEIEEPKTKEVKKDAK